MRKIRVGGRRYADPDILSLISATGELRDPRSTVVTMARQLAARYREYGGDRKDPWERIRILASLAGLEVEPMDVTNRQRDDRDAVLIPTQNGRGKVLYNPGRPQPRVIFSIGHEITHTFFPNSSQGARFRTLCDPSSPEANELERLCDLGASELLMPEDDFRRAVGREYVLERLPKLCDRFGTSYETTLFRLATAHPHIAVAGLARYRAKKGQEQREVAQEALLFGRTIPSRITPEPRYRRQSFFQSAAAGRRSFIPWNKSFSEDSCLYRAGEIEGIQQSDEFLPSVQRQAGRMQAIRAPYQRVEASSEFPDVLFLFIPA